MNGIYDIHCHILPGVDDGANDLEEALRLLDLEYQSGVRTVVFTPHFRQGMFTVSRDEVSDVFERVRSEVSQRWQDLQVYLGCEFHSNMQMVEYLGSDIRYRMAGSRYVLVEFSGMDEYSYIRSRLHALQSSGYIPIVAHVERYPCLTPKIDRVEELSKAGVLIQVNCGSILGKDGRGIKGFCIKLLKRELIDFVGSDAHDLRIRRPSIGECAEFLEKRYGSSYARRILIENPEKLLR